MSSTEARGPAAGAAPPQAAGGRAAEPARRVSPDGHPGGPGPRRRRRWVAAGVVVVVVAAAAGAVLATGVFGKRGSSGSGSASASYKTSTAVVTRRSLTSQTAVNATLGYAGSYTVTGKATGTITWLPAQGRVIREGQVLYRADNRVPVYLLYGKVPAWRALAEGMTGQDVAQLNHDLVRLGYANSGDIAALGWDYFGWDTRYALQQLQAALGITSPDGKLALGSAVFLPRAIRVTTVNASLGGSATGAILTATSDRHVVTISLDAAEQSEVRAGDKVSITLPDGSTTPGVISSVGKVASGSGSSAKITVEVRLRHPKAAGRLDQAPVTVAITTASVSNVLVVPVDALLARPGGGYAVEVVSGARHHLVKVTPGLFDDAAGQGQVSGSRLSAGQRVVVPGI